MKKINKYVKTIALSLAMVTCAAALTGCGETPSQGENQETDIVLRFAVMSDVHIGAVGDTNYVRFGKAMNSAYKYAESQGYKKLDALLVAGDMTNYGWENELQAFKSALNKNVKKDTETLLIMGNHEYFQEEGPQVTERWERVLERDMNTHNVINGYHFINLSLSGYSDYKPSLEWFEAELAAAAAEDPTKPIFVQQHYPVKNTVYGSDLWGTDQLTTIMEKYPQIVSFSGHSHYPINDPRSIWQDEFTSLGCGTLAYYELEPGMMYGTIPPNSTNACQYYIVEVHKDSSVTIKAYDVMTEQFFDFEYTIEKPADKDSFKYTDARADVADKPVFAEGAKVTVESVGKNNVKLTIPQATDGECMHSYRFDFYVDGELVSSDSIWSEFYFLDTPKTLTQEFKGLLEGSDYTVKVTAIDSWGKESEKPITADFSTTGNRPESLNPGDEIPKADIFDIQASENGFADISGKNKVVTNDGVSVTYDETLKHHVGDFTGSNSLLVPFESKDLTAITKEVTIEVGFVVDSFKSPYSDIMGCMQSGGYGFELNAGTNSVEFWIMVNGNYVILSAPVEKGVYYEAVGAYNGRTAVLYLNGEAVARKSCTGSITYPSASGAHSFRIGADIASDGGAEACFDGKITYARAYGFGVTAKQVAKLYETK